MKKLFKSMFYIIASFSVIFSLINQSVENYSDVSQILDLSRIFPPSSEDKAKIEVNVSSDIAPICQKLLFEVEEDELGDFFSKCSLIDHYISFDHFTYDPNHRLCMEVSFSPSFPRSRGEWLSRFHSSLSPPSSILIG